MADFPHVLKTKEFVEGEQPQEQLDSGSKVESTESSLEGSVEFKSRAEREILEQVRHIKEKEIERKDGVGVLATDDSGMPADDPNDDDDVKHITETLKYYGYEVSKQSMQSVSTKIKGKLGSSDTWLSVWLSRLLQMN